MSPISEKSAEVSSSIENLSFKDRKIQQIESQKRKIQNEIGTKKYKKIYAFLLKHRKKLADDQKIQKGLDKLIDKKNPEEIRICNSLDMVVIEELSSGKA